MSTPDLKVELQEAYEDWKKGNHDMPFSEWLAELNYRG